MGSFYYCPYCKTRVEKASLNSRRQHALGRRHISMKVEYYQTVIRQKGVLACGPPGAIIPNQLRTAGMLFNLGVAKGPVVGQMATPTMSATHLKNAITNISQIEEQSRSDTTPTSTSSLPMIQQEEAEAKSDFVSAGQVGLQKLLELQKAHALVLNN